MRRQILCWPTTLAIALTFSGLAAIPCLSAQKEKSPPTTSSTESKKNDSGPSKSTEKSKPNGKDAASINQESKNKQSSAEPSSTKTVIPIITLGGAITESPQGDDPFFGSVGAESLKDLIARLEAARDDDDVKAIVLFREGPSLGRGQLEEFLAVVNEIRSAGKPVYGHVDSLDFGGLCVMSACSRLSVVPTGDVMILGMYGEQPYLRDLLDKVHVTPDFLTCGDYKSAGEMYTHNKPSPESERMTAWLFDSLFGSSVSQIADGRKVSSEKVRDWIDQGLFSANSAAKAGVIDAVEYRADFVKHIEQQHGDNITFDKRYGKKKAQTIDFGNPFAIFKIWGEMLQGGKKKTSTKDAVGIVYVEGPIMPGQSTPSPFMSAQQVAYSTPIRKALDEVAADDTIKAVVLRVNSPGGSVVASEIILQATKRIADRKPLVVSMGDVAGSGGYYVACGSKTIFADAATITGSIGVVAGKLATRKMWDEVGVQWHPVSRGKNSGMLLAGEVFTDEQRDKLQSWMDEVYEDFKGHVTKIRGERLKKPIDEIAGGRVYTGRQALELGLVDRIGGLSDAIQFVAKEAKLQAGKYDVRIEPQPKSFIEILMEDSTGDDDSDPQISLRTIATEWQTASLWKSVAPLVRNLEPHRLHALQRAFVQLEILQREGITLALPEVGQISQ